MKTVNKNKEQKKEPTEIEKEIDPTWFMNYPKKYKRLNEILKKGF